MVPSPLSGTLLEARVPRSGGKGSGVRVAYLINAYPATSHSFIRREIHALESLGVDVNRYSIRPVEGVLVTAADRDEQARTRVLLRAGAARMMRAMTGMVLSRPVPLMNAIARAIQLGWRSDRGLLRHFVYLAEACILFAWTKRSAVSHIHAHFGTNPASVALLCRVLGGPPFSFTVHGPEEFDKPEFLGLALKVQEAAFVVAVSSFGRSQVWRWAHHRDWNKVRVVRCGLEQDLIGAEITPVPDRPRLLCVARLSEQKGHLLLMEASALLAKEGYVFDLVLVGDGPLRSGIEEFIRTHRLEAHVHLPGWMSGDQVRDEIRACRALVQPSFAEGLPVVLMEAMALGRPVVTTHIAGIPELVENGVSGWLVPAGSVDDLVEALRGVLKASPAMLTAMGRNGRRRVAANHSAAQEAGKLLELFVRSSNLGAEPAHHGLAAEGAKPIDPGSGHTDPPRGKDRGVAVSPGDRQGEGSGPR